MATTNQPILVWNEAAHLRFGEQLFFFLLALKPYKEEHFIKDLDDVMAKYGIGNYCSYELFGEFDHLLRVWLPAGESHLFIEEARKTIRNLKEISIFHVQRIPHDWRFKEKPDTGVLKGLTPDVVTKVQKHQDAKAFEVLKSAHLVTEIPIPIRRSQKGEDKFKAFICIAPPERAFASQRDFHQGQLIDAINEAKGLSNCTFHQGIGFTWLLVKAVAKNVGCLAQIVEVIAKKFGPFGISTSTYLAFRSMKEGDCIGERALNQQTKADPGVQEFLPSLYTMSISEPERTAIEEFVKYLLKQQLEPRDLLSFHDLLSAVTENDALSASTALFPRLVETERLLRDSLKVVAGKYFPDGVRGLLQEVDPDKREVKGMETMALGHVLKSCQIVLKRLRPDFAAPCSDSELSSLALLRNRVMHGVGIDPASEWRNLTQGLLLLIKAREVFRKSLNDYLNEHVPTEEPL